VKAKALEGLKVVEYGNLVSAPYCTKLLACLGAEVIKVETPGEGDKARSHGPFPDDTPHPERSGLFLSLNVNKLGITLNLDTTTGRKILKRLLEGADVFVENNRPQRLAGLGFDYRSLEKINHRLVMASITPFGQSGPYKDYKAYDINCCAAGGVSAGIGEADREPLALPLFQASYQAGASAAAAILVALIARQKTGEGQHIDISEVDVIGALHTGINVVTFIYRGVTGIRRGIHAGHFLYPCTCLPCQDGYISLNAPQLQQWLRFLELMGNPKWADNPRYRDRRAMNEQYPEEVDALLIPWLKEHTMEEIRQLCQERRVPCTPVYNIGDLANHPHLKERNFYATVNHSQVGKLKYPGGPFRFSKTEWRVERGAPLLGEHNEQILGQRLGYSKRERLRLKNAGVL
jgi:crotonobetainyl-CoA:carnitine CoA-transferase CaiB-like acyl-CoA transferase